MSSNKTRARLITPQGDIAEALASAEHRGLLTHVIAVINESRHYPVNFISPDRLKAELHQSTKFGEPFLVEFGLIVVDQFKLEILLASLCKMEDEGNFEYMSPMTPEEILRAHSPHCFEWPPYREKTKE